ncbi:MAG: hypothetical protein WD597_02230, partial [Balneolaceae bacterium]
MHGYRQSISLKNDQIIEDKATSDLFHGISSSKVRRLPTQLLDSAIYKLDILNAATSLDDLRSPPGNRLEHCVETIKNIIVFGLMHSGES